MKDNLTLQTIITKIYGDYKKGMKKVNSFKIMIILILVIQSKNMAFCGTIDIIPASQSIADLINNMDEQDLILLGENLQINHMNVELNPIQEEEQIRNNSFRGWASVALFITGTILLWYISRYGYEILNQLFNLSTEIVNQGIRGFLQHAIDAGHIQQVREMLIKMAEDQLNDPETAPRVVNAFRAVGHRI